MAGGKTAILAIRIISDAKDAQRGLNDTADAAGRFERGMNTAKTAAAGVLGGLALVGKASFDSASRLQQSAGAVESVFAAQEAAVDRLAAGAADRLGLAASEYGEFASVLGSQLKNLGFPTDQLVGKQEELQQMGADLAATFGGTTADAVGALSSAMRGERDPIERYGISLNQAAIDSKVAAMGLDTSTDAAKKNADAQATLALLTEQGAAAQGAFARESDTAAGAQQRASANFENAKAKLGEGLLPIVSAVATKLSELAGFVTDNSTAFTVIAGILAGLAITVYAVNAAIAAYRAIAIVSTAAQWLWNTAMLANPLVWIAIAVIAVVAAVVLMYQKFEWFRDFVQGAFTVITTGPRLLIDFLKTIWDKVTALGGSFTSFGDFAKAAFDLLTTPITWLIDKLKWIADKLGIVQGAKDFIGGLFGVPATPALAAGRYAAVGAGELAAAGNLRAGSMLLGATPLAAPSSSTPAASGPAVVINVSGAIDPLATARQIRALLAQDDKFAGRGVAVKVSGR